jgi:hypothetical protein
MNVQTDKEPAWNPIGFRQEELWWANDALALIARTKWLYLAISQSLLQG